MNYSPEVREHFRRPRRAGAFAPQAPGVGRGRAGRLDDGVVLQIELRHGEDGRIADARFKAYGPPEAIACGSWLSEWVVGRRLDEVAALRATELARCLALAPEKMGCALIAEDALRAGLRDLGERGVTNPD